MIECSGRESHRGVYLVLDNQIIMVSSNCSFNSCPIRLGGSSPNSTKISPFPSPSISIPRFWNMDLPWSDDIVSPYNSWFQILSNFVLSLISPFFSSSTVCNTALISEPNSSSGMYRVIFLRMRFITCLISKFTSSVVLLLQGTHAHPLTPQWTAGGLIYS